MSRASSPFRPPSWAPIPDLDLDETFDTVIMLSAIHYMFSDRAGTPVLFHTMGALIEFMTGYATDSLLVEWVGEDDVYAQKVVLPSLIASGEYSKKAFLADLESRYSEVRDLGRTHCPTRSRRRSRTP